MTAGSTGAHDRRHLRRVLTALFLIFGTVGIASASPRADEVAGLGPTVGERIALLTAERARLQARAGGEARLVLLPAFRQASALTDAILARSDSDTALSLDDIAASRRQAFAALDTLNAALRDAVEWPGEGSARAAAREAERANAELERLAGLDDAALVLSYTPRFVPPRWATGELTLVPHPSGAAAPADALRLEPLPGLSAAMPLSTPGTLAVPSQEPSRPLAPRQSPTVPRYAPDFAASRDEDPPVQVEVFGVHLAPAGEPPPVLAVGAWRGVAVIGPDRLMFTVPRAAFTTDATRSVFAVGTLSVQRASRVATFQLVFTVLPDRPGAFALDQRVVTTESESNTHVSPEILVRAAVGETRTLRRCFDPPSGWHFAADRRRVVLVERLGWQDDVTDPSLNSGSVEFVPPQEPGQICVAVIARPVTRTARTATIGRFEATLVRDRSVEQVTKSGVRALDWREVVRVPLQKNVTEWKLYVRLFGEIDRELDGTMQWNLPFLRVLRDAGDQALILKADQSVQP
jgi:hypothetical protein